jgi:hypothetical protein
MMPSTKWCTARRSGLTQSEQVVEEYLIPSPSVLSQGERKTLLVDAEYYGTKSSTSCAKPERGEIALKRKFGHWHSMSAPTRLRY